MYFNESFHHQFGGRMLLRFLLILQNSCTNTGHSSSKATSLLLFSMNGDMVKQSRGN